MTATQYRTLYPRAREVRKRSEVGETVLHSINPGDPRLKGISGFWAYFLDGQLYFLVIDYTQQTELKRIDQFVERFSNATGLRTKWEGDGLLSVDKRTLRCHGFVVTAKLSEGHPRVTLQDRAAILKLNKREEQLK